MAEQPPTPDVPLAPFLPRRGTYFRVTSPYLTSVPTQDWPVTTNNTTLFARTLFFPPLAFPLSLSHKPCALCRSPSPRAVFVSFFSRCILFVWPCFIICWLAFLFSCPLAPLFALPPGPLFLLPLVTVVPYYTDPVPSFFLPVPTRRRNSWQTLKKHQFLSLAFC